MQFLIYKPEEANIICQNTDIAKIQNICNQEMQANNKSQYGCGIFIIIFFYNFTGELDDDTLHTMSLPRCGVRDKVGVSTYSRAKRYALQGE